MIRPSIAELSFRVAYPVLVRATLLRGVFGEPPLRMITRLRCYRLWALRCGARPHKIERIRVGNLPPGDGGGAQIQGALAAFVFASLKGLEYVHIPLKTVMHSPQGEINWVTKWNQALRFPKIRTSQSEPISLDSKRLLLLSMLKSTPSTVLCSREFRKLADSSGRSYELVREQIRSLYPPAQHQKAKRSRTGLRVAVHVRRGDVSERGPESWRYTASGQVIASVGKILQLVNNPVVTIFSNGTLDELEAFIEAGWRVDIDSDALQTLEKLVTADVLVMSKSSFSYVAGVLSTGKVFYEDFWHPPLPSWVNVNSLASSAVCGSTNREDS